MYDYDRTEQEKAEGFFLMRKTEDLEIGVMLRLALLPAEESLKRLRSFGLRHCQFAGVPDSYLYGEEGRRNTSELKKLMEDREIASCSVFCSFPEQDWKRARETVGLTPPETRAERIARACRTADWAKEMGIEQIAVHVGYLPEDLESGNYQSFIRAMQGFTRLLESNGQVLAYETGQEPLDRLIRTMNDVGTPNQRINFDPANLLYYNNNDPMEFVETLSSRIVHIHCKDAVRPLPGDEFGHETRLGEGDTNFQNLFRTLYEKGYRGPLTIEREIAEGEELNRDIRNAILLLNKLKQDCTASPAAEAPSL